MILSILAYTGIGFFLGGQEGAWAGLLLWFTLWLLAKGFVALMSAFNRPNP